MGRRIIAFAGAAFVGAAALTAAQSREVTAATQGAGIVFSSNRDGDWDIFVANGDGAGITKLTSNGVDDTEPAPSPDGTRILFAREEETWAMNADGSDQRQLTRDTTFGDDPAWSPDGSVITFIDSLGNLWRMNPDGSGKQKFPYGSFERAWSPDSTELATIDAGGRLIVVSRDGTKSRLLAPARARAPAWSPDGARIAYAVGDDRPGGRERLFVVNRDGSGRRALGTPFESEVSLTWSPDGDRLAFASRRNGRGPSEIYVTGSNGAGEQRITHSAVGEDSVAPRWASDGRTILFLRGRFTALRYDTHNRDLYAIAPDGSALRALTRAFPDGGDNAEASWVSSLGNLVGTGEDQGRTVVLTAARVLRRRGVSEIAADGTRVALVEARPGGDCGAVSLWHVGTGALRRLAAPPCNSKEMLFGGVYGLALTRKRAAWIFYAYDTHEGGDCLMLSPPAPRRVHPRPPTLCGEELHARGLTPFVEIFNGGTETPQASDFGNVVGNGSLLVFNSWQFCYQESGSCDPHLPFRFAGVAWRIVGNRRVRLRSGPSALDLAAVGGGRIVVVNKRGPVLLLRAAGRLERTFSFGPGEVNGAALEGSTLIIMRRKELAIYDVRSGTLEQSWPVSVGLGSRPLLEGARLGFAVYTSGIALHLIRLADGADVVLDVPNEGPPAAVRLTSAGLVYSYNEPYSANPGRVGYVPFTALAGAFARNATTRR